MNPANPDFEKAVRENFVEQRVMSLIGAELSTVAPGVVEISLPFRPDLTQQDGFLHAGVITTIADSAAGYAAYTMMPAGSRVLSIEFKVNLMRPARGETFVARAEVIKSGRTLSVVRADVFAISADGEKEMVATMQGTMMCLR
ncbi:MAG TPA: PaaI family thioesterase [Pyrinomonadaceae bacterium]|nr:PaaI family thioesterase [Pyrinomonadaceae bacterium]